MTGTPLPSPATAGSGVLHTVFARLRRRPALALLGIPVCIGSLLWFWLALPDPLFRAPLSPVLYASNGELIGARIATDRQWRFPLQTAVPERFSQALIRYEDQRFAMHPGVDPLALLRASWSNLRAGRVVSGASTLSMQVIRVASGNPPRSLPNKLREMLLAVRLELRYDKAKILALYAQHAPFGGNLVGLETAAWRYFGRAAKDLSWAEAAALAVLPNSPGLIHPGRGRERLREKRDRLLRALHDDRLLDALDLRLALAEPLPDAPRPLPRLAPHLLDTLTGQADGTLAPAFYSTLDADLQRTLVELMQRDNRRLDSIGVHNAAALVIDHRDLSVIAYLGNSRHENTSDHGYAIDLIQRPRSSGSILKPLLYALMLQGGQLLPQMLVADVPTRINGYAPENFDRSYRGAVPASEALALSLNIPAVRLLREYGMARFHAALKQMGVQTLTRPPEHYGLTLILGGAEVRPWDVAQSYANLASIAQLPEGATASYRRPRLLRTIDSVVTGDAEYGSGAAWLTLQAMAEVNRPGIDSNWRSFASSRPVAWKTGTSFGLKDAWAVGSTPRYTVAVWAGNASGEGVAGLSGTQVAAPLLFAILARLPDSGWFAEPLHDLKSVETCRADGYLPHASCPIGVQWAPRSSHFQRASPFHRWVHLDPQLQRVHSGCAAVADMHGRSWFVLPAALEHFYRQHHPEYRPLPRWRNDCTDNLGDDETPIGLLYPQEGSQVYIPAELDGSRSRVVFEAVHRQRDAVLHWHLDQHYLGSTREFHQLEVLAAAGAHRLTLVDQSGRRLSRRFTVLSKHQR